MKKIKTLMKLLPFLVMGIVVLNSCEGELDNLGSQLVDGADGVDKVYSVIGYNINNNDVIQTDASKLDSVRIGSFNESVFGAQKVSYLTQLRLDTYNPDFGKNPVIDSVVLTLKPRYATAADSITTTTNEDYIYPDGEVAAKKVVTTYPVSKYGRTKKGKDKLLVNVKVNEVNDFMGGASDSLSSNKVFALGSEIGSKSFNGTVNSVVITKDSDGSELVNRAVSFRMQLDKPFFQDKIIAKQGNQVLKDAASFIRYFKGISISVDEADGYLFSMAPNDAGITIYYKNDVTATDGTVTRTKAETTLNLSGSNTHFSHIVFNRSADYNDAMAKAINVNDLKTKQPTPDNYATKLYMQSMGGSSIGLRIPASTILELKKSYKDDKIAIVSAKLRLYNDDESWNNSYRKPSDLLVRQNNETGFLPDMTLLSSAGYSLIKAVNLTTKDAYYDIGITASLKKIIEDDTYDITQSKDFIINIGSYLSSSSTGLLLGQTYNNRSYNPYRILLKGTDMEKIGLVIPNTSKAAQLRLIYTKK